VSSKAVFYGSPFPPDSETNLLSHVIITARLRGQLLLLYLRLEHWAHLHLPSCAVLVLRSGPRPELLMRRDAASQTTGSLHYLLVVIVVQRT
jgi:hypothetical protein